MSYIVPTDKPDTDTISRAKQKPQPKRAKARREPRMKKYPVKKRFELNGVEFYIDSNCGTGRGGNYSVYCITDHKNLVTRARIDTCIKRIEERANK